MGYEALTPAEQLQVDGIVFVAFIVLIVGGILLVLFLAACGLGKADPLNKDEDQKADTEHAPGKGESRDIPLGVRADWARALWRVYDHEAGRGGRPCRGGAGRPRAGAGGRRVGGRQADSDPVAGG